MLIDTHCHLNHPAFEADVEECTQRAVDAEVRAMVVIGYDLPSSRRAVQLAEHHETLWAAVGIHPHDADAATGEALQEIAGLAESDRVVAIGEIGLDFYRDRHPVEVQEAAFKAQLSLATRLGLPVIIHTRESTHATLTVLSEVEVPQRGVLHCWSGTPAEAEAAQRAGWFIGLGGVVTFKNAQSLHEIARSADRDRILLETDSPWLAPHPNRGKRNEPAFLPHIASRLAELRSTTSEDIAQLTTRSAIGLFPRMRLPAAS